MAMDITYTCVGGMDYIFTVTIYRDCDGVSAPSQVTLNYESASCGQNFAVTIPQSSFTEVSQVCVTSLSQTTCNGGTIPGTEAYTYSAPVTLPAVCSDWTIYWSSCCRNSAITNLQTPGSRDMYIQVTLDNTGGLCNNSPQYAANPVPYICANQLFTFNHGASDPDGDSLVYSLAQPLEGNTPPGTLIPYVAGHTVTAPVLTTAGFTFDTQSGQMCFTPNQQQQCVVSVLIQEYRGGVIIATHIREMQVIVSAICSNQPPTVSGSGGCGSIGSIINVSGGPSVTQMDSNTVRVCPGDSVIFQIPYVDPEGNTITVIHTADSLPGASLVTVNDTSTFTWLPSANDSGSNVFTVNLQDDACPIAGSQYFAFEVLVLIGTTALPPIATICDSLWADFSATGGDNFTWTVISGDPMNVGVNFTCDTCANVSAIPDTTTEYEVVSNLASSCNDRDTVTVFVVPGYTYTKAQTDTGICLLEDATFTVVPDSAGYTYSWYPNTFLDFDTGAIVTGTFTVSGTQTVYFDITSPFGCVKTDSFTVQVSPNVQPVVTITGDTTICLGDSTQLTATIGSSSAQTEDDFDPGIDGSVWSTTSGGAANVSCGSMTGNALHFDGAGTREAVTNASNTTTCTSIDFCIVFGTGSAPCENADTGEDVVLEYSNDGGTTWITINTYLESIYTTWTCVSEPIPLAAQTSNTMFRWQQLSSSGSGYDAWALDDVQIICSGTDNLVYTWTPSSFLSSTTIQDPWASPPTDMTYYVTVVDTIGGCMDTDSINVYIVPNFVLTTLGDDTLCDLGSATIQATVDIAGVYTYAWNNGSTLSDSTIFDPSASPTQSSTTYTVLVSSAAGCDKTDSVTILLTEPPGIELVPGDTTICSGQGVLFDVNSTPDVCGLSTSGCVSTNIITAGTATTTNDGFTYPAPYGNWYWGAKHQILYTAAELNALGFSGGTISEIGFEIGTVNGTSVYDNFEIKIGCTSITSIATWQTGLVTVFPAQTINPAAGWNTHVFTTGFDWDGVSNIILEICFNNSSYTNNMETYYSVTPFNSVIWYRADNSTVCPTPGTGNASDNRPNTRFGFCGSASMDDYSIIWSPATDLSSDTILNPIATPTTTTTYTLTATHDITGCPYTATQTVDVIPGFGIAMTPPSDTAVCLNETIQFSVNPDTTGTFTYSWTPAGFLNVPTSSNPVGTMDTPGSFVFTVNVNKAGGCIMSDSIIVIVGPKNAPVVSVTADPDTVCSVGIGTAQLDAVLADTTVFSAVEDNFNPSIDMTMWSSITGVANTDCGSMSGNALHFDGVTREAVTNTMNATSCTTVDFCLIIGSGTAPCENADPGDDVELQYSTDGGLTWTTIMVYSEALYTTWTCISETVPAGAQTASTLFRFTQPVFAGPGSDNWAIDDVSFSCGGGNTSYYYDWTFPTTLNDSTISNPNATLSGSVPITYTVIVTDSIGGCTGTDSVTIQVENPMLLFLVAPAFLCDTAPPVILNSSDPNPGTWTGNGIVNATAGMFDAGTAGIGSHTITYTANDICQSDTSIVILIIGPPPPITLDVSTLGPFCEPSTNTVFDLDASPAGGTWSVTGTTINPSTGELSSSPSGSFIVNYNITACGYSDTNVTVTIHPVITTTAATTQETCDGSTDGTANIAASNGSPPFTYVWSTGETTNNITNLSPGTYNVTVTDSYNCNKTVSLQVSTSISQVLFGNISATDETCQGASDGTANIIVNSAISNDSYSYLWDNNEISEEISDLAPGVYIVTVINSIGCILITSTAVGANAEPCPLDIPNIFAPADADLNNRVFKLFGVQEGAVKELKLIVYDRWGHKVFEAGSVAAAETGWDGTKNGKPMPAGVYVYYLDIEMNGENHIIRKGDVTLLR